MLFWIIVVFSFFCRSSGFQCRKNEFPCEDGKQCVKKEKWCNEKIECFDESDELYCDGKTECNPNKYFMCDEGPCIPLTGKCDGTHDCEDMTDESDRVCEVTISDSSPAVKPVVRPSLFSSTPVQYQEQLRRAVHWLVQQRGADFGWGENTPRALTALCLAREEPFNEHNASDMLMNKNLDIQLAFALERNTTQVMTPSDLALYINALLATCRDPRNFYGFDLVSLLRHRTDTLYGLPGRITHLSPIVPLTLCTANSSNFQDERWLKLQLERDLSSSLDMKALAILAGTCLSKLPSNDLKQITWNEGMKLIRDIENKGHPGNVDEASLVILALDELLLDNKSWNRSQLVGFILKEQTETGGFGGLLATYHATQVLSGKSLCALRNHCEKSTLKDETSLEVVKNTRNLKLKIIYAVRFPSSVVEEHKLELKVAKGINFLTIMRLVQEDNDIYSFKLDKNRKIPFVYSIGGVPNDVERGLRWQLYLRRSSNAPSHPSRSIHLRSMWTPFEGDISSLIPHEGYAEFLFTMTSP